MQRMKESARTAVQECGIISRMASMRELRQCDECNDHDDDFGTLLAESSISSKCTDDVKQQETSETLSKMAKFHGRIRS